MRKRRKALFRDVAQTVLRLREIKSEETRKSARQWIPRLIKAFGKTPIAEIQEEHWVKYVSRERARRERKFFTDRKFMRLILRFAESRGLVRRRIELPIPDLPWDSGRELTDLELRLLRQNSAPLLKFQIEIGWKMGLRLREMLRLRREQIDLKLKVIFLGACDTKTRKGRVVPIPPDLCREFSFRLAKNTASWLFPTPGVPLKPQTSNKTAWTRLKRKTGVTARWHDLRHTCASRMLRAGIRREVVRRYLGMSEPVLERIYTHLSIDDLRLAARAMSQRKRSSR